MCLAHGCTIGWTSPALIYLESDETHLKKTVTLEQASWIAACLPVGAFFGTL